MVLPAAATILFWPWKEVTPLNLRTPASRAKAGYSDRLTEIVKVCERPNSGSNSGNMLFW